MGEAEKIPDFFSQMAREQFAEADFSEGRYLPGGRGPPPGCCFFVRPAQPIPAQLPPAARCCRPPHKTAPGPENALPKPASVLHCLCAHFHSTISRFQARAWQAAPAATLEPGDALLQPVPVAGHRCCAVLHCPAPRVPGSPCRQHLVANPALSYPGVQGVSGCGSAHAVFQG